MNNKVKRTQEFKLELNDWRSDGMVLNSVDVPQSDVISILKSKDVIGFKLVVETEEPKDIRMTETEFQKLIKMVETWDNPVAELKSRLKNRRYYARNDE